MPRGSNMVQSARQQFLKSSGPQVEWAYRQTIAGIDASKVTRALEIGSGNGHFAMWYCLRYPQVTLDCLDEYEGHGNPARNFNDFRSAISAMKLTNCSVTKVSLEDAELPREHYDLVLACSVLHHIHEYSISLLADQSKMDSAVQTFAKVHSFLRPGGLFVARESATHNIRQYVEALNYNRVDYSTKQEPEAWKEAALRGGFERAQIVYHHPWKLRWLPRFVAARKAVNIFAGSGYYLRAHRGEG